MKKFFLKKGGKLLIIVGIVVLGFTAINSANAQQSCPPGGPCPPNTGSGFLGNALNWFGGSGNTGGNVPVGNPNPVVNTGPLNNMNMQLPALPGGSISGNTNPVAPAPKSTLYTSRGWDTPNASGTGGNSTCGPCNDLATTNGKFDQAKADFIKQNYNVETNGTESTPTIKDPNGNKLTAADAKKKIDEEFAKVNQKPINCGLVEPGQSKVNGDMWGMKGIALVREAASYPEFSAFLPNNPTKTEDPACGTLLHPPCTKDIDGNDALTRMSELNWWFLKANPTKKTLGITSDTDYDLLTAKGKTSVTIDGKSNQANLTSKMKGATIYVPKTKEEHEQYRSTYPATPSQNPKVRNGYTPKNGSTMRMTPGAHTNRLTNSADNATPSAPGQQTQLGNMPDTKVTDDCKFEKATPNDWGQLTNRANQWGNVGNGGTGGGGGGGGGLEGILPEILKALQSGLSGLGKGQGGQQSSPSPTPSYICPPDSNPVCGEDGKTYENRCIAEYKNQIEVKHTGVCTEEDENAANLSENSAAAAALLKELTTSGMPTQLVTDLLQIVSKLMASFLTGKTVLQETVVQ